jgi:MFS family permease
MAAWGLLTTLHIWVRTRWQLILLRSVIGILEAGFYPTTVAYLSLFYTRYEFGRRLGLFYGQYAVAGALGGLLSYAVFSRFPHTDNPKPGAWRSWQVLFVIEGVATVILALIGFFWLPHNARSAWFLKDDERRWAEERIERDQMSQSTSSHASEADEIEAQDPMSEEAHALLQSRSFSSHAASSSRPATDDRGLSKADIVEAVFEWKLWYLLMCNILSSIPVTAFSVFLPLVLKPLASSPAYANLLTAPPFLFGAVIMYGFTHWSDVSRQRMVPILWSLGLILLGLGGVVAIPSSVPALRYIALCVLLSGTFVASPLTIAWFTGNTPEIGKRSVILGINGWGKSRASPVKRTSSVNHLCHLGNLAGVLSSMLFQPKFGPTYNVPFFITLALMLFAFVGYGFFRVLLIQENRTRKALLESWSEAETEAERQYGRGPLASRQAPPTIINGVKQIFGDAHSDWIRDAVESEGRRGDERITFQYGL